MGEQAIPNQTNFVRKDRENSLTYFRLLYRTEMQINFRDKLQEKKSQSREVNSLDSKHLKMQALRKPPKDRYNSKRSGKHDCDEGPKNAKFTGYFQGQANLDTGKVEGYYHDTHARETFENPSSTQAPDNETVC